MSQADQVARVRKYIGQLKDETKLAHALSRLDRIDMSVALLTETGVGKEVNRLRNHPEFGSKAVQIVDKWRKLAREQSEAADVRSSTNGESAAKKRPANSTEEISGSQMSFAEALAAAETPVEKKKCRVVVKEAMDSPDDQFMRLDYSKLESEPEKADEVDPAMFSIRKGKPMKVYAGRKQAKSVKMDSLFNLAMTVCMQNIDYYTHSQLPTVAQVFWPVLTRCTPEQLERIEFYNPTFEEDTDELWKAICLKAFKNALKTKDSDETWKECYKASFDQRNIEEREKRLQQISSKIKKDTKVETHKVTQLSDAITPGYIRRRQINNGTVVSAGRIPNALEVSKARKQIYYNGSRAEVEALPSVIKSGGFSGPSRGPTPQKNAQNDERPPSTINSLFLGDFPLSFAWKRFPDDRLVPEICFQNTGFNLF
uniref:TFIIS N-terminal domain-containing protein n=1 Tax=Panagrolaimus sp. JU765 TaxID=591449 RepID=A0AC34QNT8_9BILA